MHESVNKKILFMTKYERNGASSRYRFLQYIPWFERAGFECTVSAFFSDAALQHFYQQGGRTLPDLTSSLIRRLNITRHASQYDLVIMQYELMPFIPAFAEHAFARRGVEYVVDYDDAIFHRYDTHKNPLVRALYRNKIKTVMCNARAVVAGNEYIAEYARKAGAVDVEVIPTVVDLALYATKSVVSSETFKIAWIGSPSTSHYLELVRDALNKICTGETTKLIAVGAAEKHLYQIQHAERRRWSESTEVANILECDVGVMPLADTQWEKGKCGLKLIQYMACGLPVVASPVGVNRVLVEHGVNGFLASTSDEWERALSTLKDDPNLRSRMGAAGRKKVEESYSLQRAAPRWLHLIDRIMA